MCIKYFIIFVAELKIYYYEINSKTTSENKIKETS